MKTAIVAINQLPTTPDTLWLRILGKGTTQQQAIAEIIALPETNPLRTNILALVSTWRVNLQTKQDLTEEDRELIMNLTPAYIQWREETLLQGRQEGLQTGLQQGRFEERRVLVENLLIAKFGSIDERLSGVIQPIIELPPQELTRILLELDRENLLARFENREHQ
jgi:flagellar biosynthesis/type III secretory pathway protein FliH